MASKHNEIIGYHNLDISYNKHIPYRRLIKEIEYIQNNRKDIFISIKSGIKLNVFCEYKKSYIICFDILLSDAYPFSPVKIEYFLNKERKFTHFFSKDMYSYIQLLGLSSCVFKDLISDSNCLCLCCSSYTCIENWNPSIKLIKIIDEAIRNTEIIHKQIKKLLKNKIYEKYLGYSMKE